MVQTAYCNSRITKFLNDNGVKNTFCKTGVKHAHPIVEKYDIGGNDEPNGHGTVAYKQERINAVLKGNNSLEAQKLRAILSISNKVVGDALANLLVMEAILYDLDMSIEQFSNFIIDNPSLNIKTVVSDRTKFKTIEDETRLTEPTALQEAIDKAVTEVEEGRAFVRPSGTEDILRIYSEAKTVEETRELGENIKNIIDTQFKNI